MRKTLSLLAALLAVACGGDEQTDTSALQPTITQQEANARYRVKAGRELLIAPSYTNAEGARFTWTCDDEVVCREASYVFRRDKAGIYYLSLRVENDYGAAEDELRVRVDALEAPCITLIEPVGGFTVAADAELTIAPTVENGQTARFRWTIDGEMVGEAAEYLFRRHECGDYEVTFSAANDDGEDSVSFTVKVLSPEQMPFSWEFPQTAYNVALGRTIRLKGWNPVNAFDAEYIWEVDGTERQRGAQLEYRFEALEEGPHEVTVTMRNSYATRSQTLSVNVCAAEGTYYRPADAASRASTVRVFEYLPAPGLWVSGYMYGPLFTATTMAEACAYVQSRFDINYMISLGAWGGYVVAGFDHSVDNSGGGVDLAIRGNPYSYSRSRASSGSHRTRTATGNPTTRGTNWPVRSTTALKRSTTIRSPTISLRARRPPSSGATTAAEGARSTTTPTGTLRTATISRGCPKESAPSTARACWTARTSTLRGRPSFLPTTGVMPTTRAKATTTGSSVFSV